MDLKLRTLPAASIDAALSLAKHYRDLNQADEAESICRDILAVSPTQPEALRLLGLALTDQFPDAWDARMDEALASFARLESDYDRTYYTGIAWERCGKAQLAHKQSRNALHSLEHALNYFDDACDIARADAPEAILRWNRCVRLLTTHPDILKARATDPAHAGHFGD